MSATLRHLTTLAPINTVPVNGYALNHDPFLFRRVRTWLLLVALFLMAQGNGLFTTQDSSYWNLKWPLKQYLSIATFFWLTVLLWTLCVGLMLNWISPTLRLMLKHKSLLAFVILAFLSTLWSQQPEMSFRRATLLFIAFAFAWFFATYYSPSDQMRLLLAAGVIVAVTSIAMALLLPQYGIASTGEWKGIFGQKNRLGLGIVFLFSGLPFCLISTRRRLLTLALQASIPIGLILLSQSKTSLILAFVLVAVRIFGPFIASRRSDQLPSMMYAAVFAILCIAIAIGPGREFILSLLGRDSTLSGRTDRWPILAALVVRHLWLGYGYYAFWTDSGDSLDVIHIVGGAMTGSDSGYMDTMLWFGVIGVFLLVVLLLATVRDFVSLFRKKSVPLVAFWYASVVIATFVGSFTEGLFLVSVGITTFIFVVACAGLRRLSHQLSLPNEEK